MKIVELKNLSFSYEKGKTILDGINLSINPGESVAVIGANGAGKSTLLNILAGLISYEGSARIKELDIIKKNLPEIRKALGFVFQDPDSQLFCVTVYDDLSFAPRNYGYAPEKVESLVDEALEKTGICDLKYRQNYKLSGGEKRMVSIATILAMKPELILMDEPSTALDPANRRNLINNLNEIDTAKLIATHDLDLVLETCERVILLSKGKIIADDKPEVVLKDASLLKKCHLELPLCYQTPKIYKKDEK